MPWYFATVRFDDGFNAVTSVQAASEDEARAWLRRELASIPGFAGSITLRPGRIPLTGQAQPMVGALS